MNCDDVRNELLATQGTPPPVEGHLATCPECAALAQALNTVDTGFAVLRALQPPKRVGVAIRQRIAVERSQHRREVMVALDTIAAAGVIASIALAAYRLYPEPFIICMVLALTSAVLMMMKWEPAVD